MSDRCGTVSGYRDHLADRTPACRPCCDAEALRGRCWRIRHGRNTVVRVPMSDLGELLKIPEVAVHLRAKLGGDLCDAISYVSRRKAA